jgi:4a-hydroxytetrahydrobiopterin dehydratase
MTRLSDEELRDRLAGSRWRRDGETIVEDRKFDDFAAALAFVAAVGALAEEANHHPDIFLHDWNQVRLTLSTHSEGGLTERDLSLARQIDGMG